MDHSSLNKALESIELEDLEYVERDLCFNELASIAILLYGEERTTAEFALQKLLIMSNTQNANQRNSTDLLRTYAAKVNQTNWRNYIVEALSIINARCVLRKLGLNWEIVRQHYLPHISELSLHLHPLLKALYKICDNLTPAQAGRLMLYIDEHHRPQQDHFRFYNSEVLEIFMLDWITRRIISVGDREANGAHLQVLTEYLKLNELEELKSILVNTIVHSVGQNSPDAMVSKDEPVAEATSNVNSSTAKPSTSSEAPSNGYVHHQEIDKTENSLEELSDTYKVQNESAGILLIINVREFYAETDAELQHLLPKDKEIPKLRQGTDVDKDRLVEVFTSFGYKPIVKENLKHTEILNIIGDCAKRSVCYDSFIVCILSHGFEGHVYGSNSIPVAITEIEEKYAVEELMDKPKLLIIQACQSKNSHLNETKRKKADPKEYLDILKAMATVPGFPSLRHTNEGSWFIQSLCKAIVRLGHKRHLLDILTAVTGEVSSRKGKEADQVMVPQLTSTLRRFFKLPPRKTN